VVDSRGDDQAGEGRLHGAGIGPRGTVAATHGARRRVTDASGAGRADRREDQREKKENKKEFEDMFGEKHSASLWERFSLCRPTRPYVEGVPVLLQRNDLASREKYWILNFTLINLTPLQKRGDKLCPNTLRKMGKL